MTRTTLILTAGKAIAVDGDLAAIDAALAEASGRWAPLKSNGKDVLVDPNQVKMRARQRAAMRMARLEGAVDARAPERPAEPPSP